MSNTDNIRIITRPVFVEFQLLTQYRKYKRYLEKRFSEDPQIFNSMIQFSAPDKTVIYELNSQKDADAVYTAIVKHFKNNKRKYRGVTIIKGDYSVSCKI